jgi:amino-acid N-acetyltransferase
MAIIFRDASSNDLPYILEIVRSVSGDYKDVVPEQFLIAEDENKIVGCVRIKKTTDFFELASLCVSPEYRGKGIGSNLVIKILKRFNNRPIYLLCSEKRQGFYQNLGFVVVATAKLPVAMKEEYKRILQKPFLKDIKTIAMIISH